MRSEHAVADAVISLINDARSFAVLVKRRYVTGPQYVQRIVGDVHR